MDSAHVFDSRLSDWISRVSRNIQDELSNGDSRYRDLFERTESAVSFLSYLAERLPTDQSSWVSGDHSTISRASDVHFALDSISQAIFLSACHLWAPSNHSARCALEHTIYSIWSIGFPAESAKDSSGADRLRFKETTDAFFNIRRYSDFDKKFRTECGTSLKERIEKLYWNLSFYVHTSNIQREMRGARPHITYDLGDNPTRLNHTLENINETLSLTSVLLCIASLDDITEKHDQDLSAFLTQEYLRILINAVSSPEPE